MKVERDFSHTVFASISPEILIEPEGTYLLWLDFSSYGLSDKELDEIIIRKGKLWLDGGSIFGIGGAGFQRINMACPWSVLEEGLSRLADCMGKD